MCGRVAHGFVGVHRVSRDFISPVHHHLPQIYVRVTELPIADKLRELRQVHLNALVKVGGVVTKRTSVFPMLKLVKFTCVRCGYVVGPFSQNGSGGEIKVQACPECQSTGPFKLNGEQTLYRNYQKICLQESPGSVPAGRVPRYKARYFHTHTWCISLYLYLSISMLSPTARVARSNDHHIRV